LARPARKELVKEGLSTEAVAKPLMMPKSALAKDNGRHNGYEVSIGDALTDRRMLGLDVKASA